MSDQEPQPSSWQQQRRQQPGYPPAPQHPAYGQPQAGYGQQDYPAPPGYVAAPVGIAFGGFWIRVVAYLIDGFVIGIPMAIVIGIVFATTLSGSISSGNEDEVAQAAIASIGIFAAGYLLMFVAIWLYEAMMTSSEVGGTLGKRAMGLRVARGSDGSRLSFGRATGRFFAKVFITGIIPFGIGYIMAGFTERKRALHDMIADTVVIKK